ncbi:MAG: class I SAM-dependent methyltransferase [Rhizobiales bacterium]|nr:class I SAM-dependent methyltransferase [Hyphomicrobiales bacterium]MBI3672754.1 class I SAM-dependent methyltransferase [Hyphomicrobiales bacterium]
MTPKAHRLAELDNPTVSRTYRRLAPIYDQTFGKFADAALRQTVGRANELDGRLLEIGVGTGLALPHYKPSLAVTGIDLSPDMLGRARERARRLACGHVEQLSVMDASRLDFTDASFDVVVALYVMTVVPDPVAVMHEMARVVKPGGRILVCNHFSVDKGLRAAIEKRLASFADVLGFRSEFPLETLLVEERLELVSRTPVKPFGFFTLLEFRRRT